VLRFLSEFPTAQIIAIEPEGRNVLQLIKNCYRYPNIKIETAALWPTTGRLRIRTLDTDSNAFQVEEDRDGDIPAVSIPEIMKRYKLDHIDLLKIDIEGSEKNLFSHPNAASWLPSVRLILVELHDRFIPGCSEAVANALKDFTYHDIVDEYDFYSSMLRR
jgi:FkbM family methyltransferase